MTFCTSTSCGRRCCLGSSRFTVSVSLSSHVHLPLCACLHYVHQSAVLPSLRSPISRPAFIASTNRPSCLHYLDQSAVDVSLASHYSLCGHFRESQSRHQSLGKSSCSLPRLIRKSAFRITCLGRQDSMV